MKIFINTALILCLSLSSGFVSRNKNLPTQHSERKVSVLVLPPFDLIANEGISPNIQKYLEDEIIKYKKTFLVKFPYKKLMNIPYQNIFDKKYCKSIINKVKVDIVIMSKLELVSQTGSMSTDKWNFKIRIFNVSKNNQVDSKLYADSLTSSEIKQFIKSNCSNLISEIKNGS